MCFNDSVFSQNIHVSEKVYVHTDRDKYVAGDTIWAKAYLFNADNHHFSTQSEVLYLNILDDNGEAILQQKHQLIHSQANIYVALPKNILATSCRLVAYTELMQNYDSDFFFHKKIDILSRSEATSSVKTFTQKIDDLDIQFFPEGGELVTGLTCRVALKTTLPNGKSVDIQGYIEDSKGERITDIAPTHLGMGVFTFIPQANTKYKALIGNKQYDLPMAKAQGYALRVDNSAFTKGAYVQISGTEKNVEPMYVWVHQGGEVLTKTILYGNSNYQFFLSNEQIPREGILHITLFSSNYTPIAERLIFTYFPKKRIQFSVNQNIEKSVKSLIQLELSATAAGSPMVEIPFSISVIDDGQLADNEQNTNLLSYLLLNSDLKGTIENSNTYFEMDEIKAGYYLDNLMLTQGWRRFVWKDLQKQDTLIHKVEKRLMLSGQVLQGNKLVLNKVIILSIWTDKGLQIKSVTTNDRGRFEVFGDWQEKIKIVVTDKNRRGLSLKLDQPVLPTFQKNSSTLQYVYQQNFIENALLMQQLRLQNAIMLNEVEIKAQKIDPYKNDDRRAMYGEPDISLEITPNMQSGISSIAQMLEGRFPGIPPGALAAGENDDLPQGGDGIAPPKVVSRSNSTMGNSYGVLILVDGVMTPPYMLSSISPLVVERVDLLRDVSKTSMYGLRAGPGKVINILTKRGNLADSETFAGKESSMWQGYVVEREFYSPKYDKDSVTYDNDRRATLYWNANLKTDKEGKAKVTFYNSDIAKRLRISIEGTDGNGNVGVLNKIIK